MSTPIYVGPFELLAPVGRGGVGEVWHARHRHLGTPIAIKVITTRRTLESQVRSGFIEELKAVAGLDHPYVIQVYDHGELDAEVGRVTNGRLVPGSPWLAMEWASGGTLLSNGSPRTWASVRHTLICLLEALAHAHARGIIHLDIKPDNVLVCGAQSLRPGLKLSDFGMAHMLGRKAKGGTAEVMDLMATVSSLDNSGRLAGTPWYMAPEQYMGRWRDFGPWTDLYALGCLIYTLLAGTPPFASREIPALARAHCFQAPPPLRTPVGLPAGFDAWLARLMAKAPEERFQHAADAAWTLKNLGETKNPRNSQERDTPDIEAAATLPWVDTRAWQTSFASLTTPLGNTTVTDRGLSGDQFSHPVASPPHEAALEFAAISGPIPALCPPVGAPPPLPASWHPSTTPSPPSVFWGLSLGLFGLRPLPLVDRERERDLIWDALHQVHHRRDARLVVLQGVAGTGKSRLVEWLGERAEELGGARVLKAIHSEGGGPGDGLVPMFLRYLMCLELDVIEARERIEAIIRSMGGTDPYEWEALTELLSAGLARRLDHPSTGPQPRLVRNAAERYAVFYHFLSHLSRWRPVILWIDDAHWGPDAIGFARYVAEIQDTRPAQLLILLTARDESLSGGGVLTWRLAELLGMERCQRVIVSPLSPSAHQSLVRQLLGLEIGLAAQIQERTAGNPLFAVQLVRDWVQRGVLEMGPAGFRLRPGAGVDLPEDLHQSWREQLRHVFAGMPIQYQLGAELAAVLGHTVDTEEWYAAANAMGLELPRDLLDVLKDRRMVQVNLGGITGAQLAHLSWSFIHGMLRESLVQLGEEHERHVTYHRACCEMLSHREATLDNAERLGRHLMAAEAYPEAMEALQGAARRLIEGGEQARGARLMEMWSQAAEESGLLEDDRRIAEGLMTRTVIDVRVGQLQRAEHTASRIISLARKYLWPELEAHALTILAVTKLTQCEYIESLKISDEACIQWEKLGDMRGLAMSLGNRAEARISRMDLDGAQADYQRALDINESLGRADWVASTIAGLAVVAWTRKENRESSKLALRSYELFGQEGNQKGLGDSLRALGRAAAHEGDLEAATRYYRQALSIFERIAHRIMEAKVWNDLAEMDRVRGDVVSAEDGYRRALSLAPNVVAEINLCTLLVMRGQFVEAQNRLEGCRKRIEASGNLQLLGAVYASLLACASGTEDVQRWRDVYTLMEGLLNRIELVEAEDIEMIEFAADVSRQTGHLDLAEQAATLAKQLTACLMSDVVTQGQRYHD